MCGRYSLRHLPEHLQEIYRITGRIPTGMEPRYNIAPTQLAPVIGTNPESGDRTMVEMRWGLVPHWADDITIGNKMFNARAETLREKPSFRGLVTKRRCIVPASGFYEWQKAGKERLPYYFQLKDGEPMALAGLWSSWKQEGESLRSFTIITTDANAALSDIHTRMPIILDKEHVDAWLDPSLPVEVAMELLKPVDSSGIERWRVSQAINRPILDGPGLLRPESVNSE